MPLIPLKIPAGVYRNGTDLDQSGRWRDANLVRWRDGSLRPVGGWRTRIATAYTGIPRGMLAWQDLSGDRRFAAGTASNLYVTSASGITTDISPIDLTAGIATAAVNTGYGGSFYGTSFYGTERSDAGNYSEATTWSLDNWGEYLVACSTSDGRLFEWQLDAREGGPQRNLLAYTEQFDNAVWIKQANVTITANAGSAPDGTLTADQHAISAASARLVSQTISVSSSTTYTFSVYVKRVSGSGNATLELFGDSSGSTTNVTAITDEWVRYTVTKTTGISDATIRVGFFPNTSGDAVLIWGAQIEVGASATAYQAITDVHTSPTVAIANAPVDNLGLMVTAERFLFALGAGGNPRLVQWCDRENNTLWTPADTNEAGDLELQTAGQIMCGIQVRGQALILTDQDAHAATYQGPPFVYGFERVGQSCGVVSRRAVSTVDAGAFWMGQESFFGYSGGAVQELPCDVADYVFGDINRAQISLVHSVPMAQYGEVWWFYPSGASNECDRYVALDYKEGHWTFGEIERTSAVPRGVFKYPLWADASGNVYEHEVGVSYEGATVFAESGPISLGAGDQVMSATMLIPDELTQGDVTATFKTRFYPNDTERTYGPYAMTAPTDVRFTGRQVRMRVEGNSLANWRVGVMRLEAKAGGMR